MSRLNFINVPSVRYIRVLLLVDPDNKQKVSGEPFLDLVSTSFTYYRHAEHSDIRLCLFLFVIESAPYHRINMM